MIQNMTNLVKVPFLIVLGVLSITVSEAEESSPVGATLDRLPSTAYPASHAIVDVTKAPFYAKGDGVTDDTDAIQRALSDTMGMHKLLYFPAGTYLVSKTIQWSNRNSSGGAAWGNNYLQGEHVSKTIIRLKDSTFTDDQKPESIMWCGGFGSADWFNNYVQDMTFDVGKKNPGAIGLQFYSNNYGAVRNCRFVASQGSGVVGLDLAHRDMNGPLLIKNCEVIGFQRGMSTGHAVNGQTFEHITVRDQSKCGFTNEGQAISIRELVSDNAVPAIQCYGTLCLIDAKLTGRKTASNMPAIVNFNGGRIFLRNIKTSGYGRALGDVVTPDSAAAFRITGPDKLGSEGPNISEYCSHPVTSPFASATTSIGLVVKETPAVLLDDPKSWANVDDFGADPKGQSDSSAAIQKAMDSGARTVFLPGFYVMKKTVIIRGKVQRILGTGGWVDYNGEAKPDFRIVDGAAPVGSIEHISHMSGGIEIDTRRTIVFRSVGCNLTFTNNSEDGELFFEDFCTHDLKLKKQKVWARQLNIENEGTHLVNDDSNLWILGYKTERGGTLLDTRGGGRSEILGGFSYTTTAGKLAPMFVNDNSSVFAFFAEVCFSGDPFTTLIQETKKGKVKIVNRGGGDTIPYASK